MKEPCPMPDAVIQSVLKTHIKPCPCCRERAPRACRHREPGEDECQNPDTSKAWHTLREMRWMGDHYAFNLVGMYVGVELDGYMHT